MQQIFTAVSDFNSACQNVRELVKKSKFKLSYFYEGLGLARAAFYKRLNSGSWQPEQLFKLAFLLEGKTPPSATA